MHDILKEQKQSDKFFDNALDVLLGVSENKNKKIKDDNLLNFYLSSVTFPNFKYEPNDKTNKSIWEYMNAADLIKIDDITIKRKLKILKLQQIKIKLIKVKFLKYINKFRSNLIL